VKGNAKGAGTTGAWGDAPAAWVAELEARLRAAAIPGRAEQERRYLKSALEHYGTSVPAVRAEVERFLRERVPEQHDATVAFAEALWERPVHELRFAAATTLAERQKLLGPDDLPLLERLLRESRTWALVDTLAPSVVGPLAGRHAAVRDVLPSWSRDPDLWLRRAALLAYLLPMRRGEPVFDEFAALADPLLEDEEFFVRKAIGWVLRERTKRRPDEVFAWLLPRRQRASRLTLREAGKNLPDEQREALLER
jgi:3-methyladenine DNA glycosylase AlkD